MEFQEIEQNQGYCPICGKAALTKYGSTGLLTMIRGPEALRLRDGSHLCGSCVRKLRVMYPLQGSFDEETREYVTYDPLLELDMNQALEANGQVSAYRESLRENYGFRSAVFVVDAAAESREGLFRAPLTTFFGQVLYGSFWMLDDVTILSGGKETKASIAAIDDYRFRIPRSDLKEWMRRIDPADKVGENGYPCSLVVQGKGIAVQPGDLIVKD